MSMPVQALPIRLKDSLDIFGSFSREVAGRNGHVLEPGDHGGRELELQPPLEGEAITAGAGAPAGEYARMTAKREKARSAGASVRSQECRRRPMLEDCVSVDSRRRGSLNVKSSDPIRI